ncbi:MAG: hypothetical protein GQ524_05690 [Anaerolineales bacterium]|nr:hypothetical protein [Anaerolineales bacterium]
MASNDLLLKGIAAAKGGDKERARALLSKVVLDMPESEEAWWWLAQSVDDPKQREFCAQKILEINPHHRGAKELLLGSPKSSQQSTSRAEIAPEPRAAQTNAPVRGRPQTPPKKKASRPRSARTSRQTIILVLLAFAVFLVFIGGAGYVFLDTTGYLGQLFNNTGPEISQTTPTQPLPATATTEGISLSSIPTWTPTPSPLPPPATPTPTTTHTPQPIGSPTPIPPTPSELPLISAAQPVILNDGTGFLTLFPDSFSVFRFEPRESLDIQSVATLTFHLLNSELTQPLTVELYLWNLTNNTWEPFGVHWGDNLILAPELYVAENGVIIAALRNWGVDPIDVDNTSFTFAARLANGLDVYYGLDRASSRLLQTPEPTATKSFG